MMNNPSQQQHGHKSLRFVKCVPLALAISRCICCVLVNAYYCWLHIFFVSRRYKQQQNARDTTKHAMLHAPCSPIHNTTSLAHHRADDAHSRRWVARVESFGSFTSCLRRTSAVAYCGLMLGAWWEKASLWRSDETASRHPCSTSTSELFT